MRYQLHRASVQGRCRQTTVRRSSLLGTLPYNSSLASSSSRQQRGDFATLVLTKSNEEAFKRFRYCLSRVRREGHRRSTERDTNVTLRQIWLEKSSRKLQLIYAGETLTDCIDERLARWDDSECLPSSRNVYYYDDGDEVSIEVFQLDDKDVSRIPRDLFWLLSTSELDHWCYRVRMRMRDQIVSQHRHRKYAIPTNATTNNRRYRKQSWNRNRTRRELFMIPGTQWCGRGHRATKYTNLGGFSAADACCRKHDTACPFFIPAFETRYGFFNWGISSMMHCVCDERFRTCLKMAGTMSADFIGMIFFNVLQTKCFVLKPQKICVKRTWWGECQSHEYRKQAYVRDNVPY